MNLFKSYQIPGGKKFVIVYDETAENPRDSVDNVETLACGRAHGKYGDVELQTNSYRELAGIILRVMEKDAESGYLSEDSKKKSRKEACELRHAIDHLDVYTSTDSVGSRSLDRLRRVMNRVSLIMPVYKYEHSGIALSLSAFSDPFDSGTLGYAFVTNAKIRQEFCGGHHTTARFGEASVCHWVPGTGIINKARRAKAEACIRSSLRTYEAFLNGEVFGYEVLGKDGNALESCYGFYGMESLPYMLDSADIPKKSKAVVRKEDPALFKVKK